jgi:hypothetical protein
MRAKFSFENCIQNQYSVETRRHLAESKKQTNGRVDCYTDSLLGLRGRTPIRLHDEVIASAVASKQQFRKNLLAN